MNTSDRHITLEEGIAWLNGIGCSDVRALGNHLLTGVTIDGYSFTTDIREHSAADVLKDTPAAMVNPAHWVATPDLTPECINEYGVTYAWVVTYFDSAGMNESRELEYHATLDQARVTLEDIKSSHYDYICDDWAKTFYDPALDFGFIHTIEARIVTIDPTPTPTPTPTPAGAIQEEELQVNTATIIEQIDQTIHDLNALSAYRSHWTRQDRQLEAKYIARLEELEKQLPSSYFAQVPYVADDNTPVAILTPVQQVMMGEQINYWYERLDRAIDNADHNDCELCASYLIALEAIIGVA